MTKGKIASRMRGCDHIGSDPVRVGPYEVRAGGVQYLDLFRWFDRPGQIVLVPLTDRGVPSQLYRGHDIVPLVLRDFGGVPPDWRALLESLIIPRLIAGDNLLAFCVGGHGRTGTFLASLIALLETSDETPDPIAAARERHCTKAVETLEQAKGIFALRGETVPEWYASEFARRYPVH